MRRGGLITSFSIFFCSITFAQEPKLILPIGHAGPVAYSVFSPDGKRVLTSSHDMTVKMWDPASGFILLDIPDVNYLNPPQFSANGLNFLISSWSVGRITIYNSATGSVIKEINTGKSSPMITMYSPDGKKILTTSEDTTKLWDAASGNLLMALHTVSDWVTFNSFSHDGKKIITGGIDKSVIQIWDTETGKLEIEFKEHKEKLRHAAFSNDDKIIISQSQDGKMFLWDAVTGKIIKDISNLTSNEVAFEFSPDGKKILTISKDSIVKAWEVSNPSSVRQLKQFGAGITVATFSPDNKKIITGTKMGTVDVWDLSSGNLIHSLYRHTLWVQNLAFSADGKKLISSAWDNSAIIWNMETGKKESHFIGHCESLASALFSPDGKKFVTASWNNNARIWDVATGTLLTTLNGHLSRVMSAVFSPDGKRIITASWDKTAKIWDVQSGKLLINLEAGDKYQLFSAQYSTDGKKIITYAEDSTLKIWNPVDGSYIGSFKKPQNNLSFIRFADEGGKVLTIAKDTSVNVWDLKTDKLIANLRGHQFWIMSARFSPDFKKVVTASFDKTIKIWESETGKLLHTINAPAGFSYAEFSPDGKKIVAGGLDRMVRIWDAETATLLAELKGTGNDLVRGTRFSPDGKKIVAISGDDINILDALTGKLIGVLKGHTSRINGAAFSIDGKKIISSSFDKTVKIWDAEKGKLLYTSFAVDKTDYLVMDEDNHYDGTEAARKMIYFNCNAEVIELEQLKDQLWVPNLAERVLNGETINATKLSDLNICNLTPVVETIEQSTWQYRFQITPRLGGLSTTIVYVNGIEVKNYTPEQLVKQKETYQLAINKSELQKFFVAGKENSITVKSLTAKNSISSRSVSINEKGNEKSEALPNLYAVVVGVSDYKGEELDLSFAAKDAVDIANAIDASAKKLLNTDGNEHVFIYKLHTGTGRYKFPEKNSIRQVFTEIAAKAQPNDILLIFFAGHGVMESEKNQFYFLTADASNATVSGALKNVGISTNELSEWIKPQTMKAQKRILIFDACNSGQAIKEMISIGQKGQNFLAARGDDKSKQIKAVEKLNERSGLFILSASASDQKAYEMGKYNQGALTYSLLKAIKEEPDILEDRKYLNISRWFNAAEKTVGELSRETGARQQPQIVSTTNFNIGVVDEEVRDKIVLPFEKPMFTRSEFRNVDLRTDNLKLRSLVDKELGEMSENNISSTIMYSPEYDGANVYAISGDYTVKGSEVIVSVILTKGGTDIKKSFEIKGPVNEIATFSKSIVASVIEWLNKK